MTANPTTPKKDERADCGGQVKTLDWELEQNGQVVASGSGPRKTTIADAFHYARVYSQDGSVVLYEIKNGKRELLVAASKGAGRLVP